MTLETRCIFISFHFRLLRQPCHSSSHINIPTTSPPSVSKLRGLLSIRRSHSLFILAWIKFFLFGLITFPHSSRHPLTSSGHVISIPPSLPETNVVDLTLIKESQRTPLHKCNLKCLRTILPNRLIKLLTFCRSVLIATESIRKMLAIPTLISSIDQLPITPFKTRGLSNISLSRLKIRHTIDLTKISPPRHIAKSNNVILFHRINVFCCYLLTKSFNRKHFFFFQSEKKRRLYLSRSD